jgi:hypothetical protein
MQTTRQTFDLVEVKKFEFSHATGNGNSVYSFIIQTPAGDVIEGKTQPGLKQHLSSNPEKLANVVIATTPSGRVIMKDASRAK